MFADERTFQVAPSTSTKSAVAQYQEEGNGGMVCMCSGKKNLIALQRIIILFVRIGELCFRVWFERFGN